MSGDDPDTSATESYYWQEVESQTAIDAAEAASAAQNTADERTVFVNQPTVPYEIEVVGSGFSTRLVPGNSGKNRKSKF